MKAHTSITFVGIIMILSSCSSQYTLDKTSVQQDVIIDGKSTDWAQGLQTISKEEVFIGAKHDSEYLYIIFIPQNKNIARVILMNGFTVWFDPNGGTNKTLGVKFPIEPELNQIPFMIGREDKMNHKSQDDFDKHMATRLLEYEVLGPEKFDRRRFQIGEDKNILIAIGLENQRLIYELKFPLTSSNKNYGIDATKGWIGIGFETGEPKRHEMGRPDGMNMGLQSGAGRGPGPGRTRPEMSEFMKPLKLWTKINLLDPR